MLTKPKPSARPTVAGIYVRVSTQEQAEGHSLVTQEEVCRKFAADQGFDEVTVYRDAGFSAKTANRPAFLRLLEDAEAGRIGTVIVLKLDRFARNRLDALVAKERLKKVGVGLVSVTEPLDDTTPAGVITEGMIQLIAEWYSADLRHKVSLGLKKRAELGLPNAMVPFGYAQAVNPNREPPTVIEEEADHIRQAYEDFATGTVTYRQIAASWNARGLRTRHRAPRGRPEDGARFWTGDSIRRLLQNPFYKGVVTYHGEELPGRHQPIVTAELWQRANRAGQRLRGKATSPTARFYLLSGIIRCAGCGMPMQGNHSNSGERYRYYREVAHRRGLECPQPQIAVRADLVEEMVDGIVKRFRAPQALRQRVVALMAEERPKNGAEPEIQLARARES